MQGKGRLSTNSRDARPGDIVFLWHPHIGPDLISEHVALCIATNSVGIVTIEINTGTPTGYGFYAFHNICISGIGHMDYE